MNLSKTTFLFTKSKDAWVMALIPPLKYGTSVRVRAHPGHARTFLRQRFARICLAQPPAKFVCLVGDIRNVAHCFHHNGQKNLGTHLAVLFWVVNSTTK